MKHNGNWITACICVSACVALTTAFAAETTANPYESIWVRNSFGLKPPPPPPEPPPPPPKPSANIKLTGITSIVEPKKAMFMVQEPNGKAEYPVLSEGEKEGSL